MINLRDKKIIYIICYIAAIIIATGFIINNLKEISKSKVIKQSLTNTQKKKLW